MIKFELNLKLQKILKKLIKRDRKRYEIALKKMDEICSSEDLEHYKNLSHDMKEFKRVHIDSHFVIIFKFDKKRKIVKFEDFQHHETIYRS